MPDIWVLAAIACKFALYLGVLGAAGTVINALVFRLERFRRMTFGFALLGLVATLLTFSLRGAALTGEASGMIDLEMLALLWGTPVGTAFVYRIAGLCLLMFALLWHRTGLWIALVSGVVALYSFDLVGHVADREVALMDIALTLHLIAIAFWIGILTPLLQLLSSTQTHEKAADLGHRFGVIASLFVPLLILAGGYIAFQLLGSFSALVGTGYGQTMMAKIALVAALLGLGAANKVRFVPKLRAGDQRAAKYLSQAIRFEWMLILGVLLATAVLTSNAAVPT